jgi:hypothetical protein
MSDIEILDLTPENIAEYGVCRYKDAKKHVELRRKIDWFKEYYPKGLRGSVEIIYFRGTNQVDIFTKCVCIYRSIRDISG